MIVGIWVSKSIIQLEAITWFALACGAVCGSIVFVMMAPERFWRVCRSVLMLVAILFLSAGWLQLRVLQTPPHRLDAIATHQVGEPVATHQRIPVHVQGVILDSVQTIHTPRRVGDPPMWGTQSTRTRIRVERVYATDQNGLGTWIRASGIARVILPTTEQSGVNHSSVVGAGDRVEMIALYSIAGGARNLGDPDYRSMSAQSNQVGTLIVTDNSMIQTLRASGLWDRTQSAHLRLRDLIQSRALRAIGALEQDASDIERQRLGMLSALLLGQRDPSFGEVYKSFQRVGVSHVLAISGFHLALVIFLCVFAIRAVGEHPKIEAAIIISILIIGALVIPMRPPIVRAGLIVIAMVLAGSVGRRYDRMTILAWVGTGLLIWRPLDAFSLGYQLSMGITALLILLSVGSKPTALETLAGSLPSRLKRSGGVWRQLAHKLGSAIWMNIACWLVAMPTILYHTGIVSLLAPFVSVVLIPMVMALMAIGYVQITIGVVHPELASHTMIATDLLAQMVRWFVVEIDGWDGSSFRARQPSALWTLGATFVIVMLVTRQWKTRRKVTMSGVCIVLVWFGASTYAWQRNPLLRIDMIDVGDGSCVLVGSGSDGVIWDCGSLDRRVEDTVVEIVHKRKLRVRDVIITHDNIDHYNAIPELVDVLGIERVWITRRMIDHPSRTWIECSQLLVHMGVEIKELAINQQLTIGSATIDCLWPDPAKVEGLSDNDTSAVVMIRVQTQSDHQPTRSVLLCGDIEGPAITNILSAYEPLHADIIELPHHGSAKANAIEFVEVVNPGIVLQSTGPTRLNDPRWDRVRNDRIWYTTAQGGGAWVSIANDGSITHGWAVGDDAPRD